MTENQTDLGGSLKEAIVNLATALGEFKQTLGKCRAQGMTDIDIRDAILMTMDEEDRPAFAQQWPYFSMMINAL